MFHEGQCARGIFVLCEGRAKLAICSEAGKRLTLRIAAPGEVLGLSASLAGGNCEVSAEMLDDGSYVSDFYLATPSKTTYSPPMLRC